MLQKVLELGSQYPTTVNSLFRAWSGQLIPSPVAIRPLVTLGWKIEIPEGGEAGVSKIQWTATDYTLMGSMHNLKRCISTLTCLVEGDEEQPSKLCMVLTFKALKEGDAVKAAYQNEESGFFPDILLRYVFDKPYLRNTVSGKKEIQWDTKDAFQIFCRKNNAYVRVHELNGFMSDKQDFVKEVCNFILQTQPQAVLV